MKTFASFFLLVSLAASCTGRRTALPAAEAPAPETAIPTEAAAAGETTWVCENGIRKRWGPFTENDTTFLFVEEYPLGEETIRCKVFIRKGPQSAENKGFIRLSPQNGAVWEDFRRQLRTVKKSRPQPLVRHAVLNGLPDSWMPIRSFEGRYYVDGLHPYPMWISDSLFVQNFMDGPGLSPIEKAERLSPTHYLLRTSAGYPDIDRVEIRIIDTVRPIAVFTFRNDDGTERFHRLFAPYETAFGMDMVDFISPELFADEVRWDDTDFEALIAAASTDDGECPEAVKNREK